MTQAGRIGRAIQKARMGNYSISMRKQAWHFHESSHAFLNGGESSFSSGVCVCACAHIKLNFEGGKVKLFEGGKARAVISNFFF